MATLPHCSLSGSLPLTISLHDPPPASVSPGAFISQHEGLLSQLLSQHGALLFRGFPLPDAAAFSAFVQGFRALRDLPYEDSLSYAVRLPVCERVCTTNEGRTGGMTFHHEQAAAPRYPSKLFFFCEQPAAAGGATGISPSWALHEQLALQRPAFLALCEAKGLLYTAALPPEADASKGVGRSWRSFFGVQTQAEAEARLRAYGYSWQWLPGSVLQMTTPVLSAVRRVPGPAGPATPVFFNQMCATAFANAKEFAAACAAGAGSSGGSSSSSSSEAAGGAAGSEEAELAPAALTFGDGSRVPLEPLRYALQSESTTR